MLAALAAVAVHAARAGAQEFVRQSLLIAPLRSDSTPRAARDARQVADVAHERLARLIDAKAVDLVERYRLENFLVTSSYRRDAILTEGELHIIARQMRLDEVVFGRVSVERGTITVATRLSLLRKRGLQQPLPVIHASTAAQAGEALAREIAAARAQLTGLRRCENALTVADRATAIREAERAIRAYPRAVPARGCLMAALIEVKTPADSVRRVADGALAIDTASVYASTVRAQALEAEKRTAEAVAQWTRVFPMDPENVELEVAVVDAMLRLQRPAAALADVRELQQRFPEEPRLPRLAFRAHAALARWKDAAALGDSLERTDAPFRADSNYTARHIEALRQVGDTLGALELTLRGMRRHPDDSRIYLQYLQLLGGESQVALPRGLTRFPDVPELYVLAAATARKAGNRAVAIRAAHEALKRDSTLTTQYLQLAELLLEEGRADSAEHVIARAPRAGDGVELVRSYAIGRGVTLLRAAGDTAAAKQRSAVTFLMLADSLASHEDSRAYVAAATLQLARNQLVLASKSKGCADSRSADSTLGISASAIERGLGETSGGAEIRQAFDAMRAAVDQATKVWCKDKG